MIAHNNIMMHCGAEAVEREAVWEVVTPEPTKTHFPVAHSTFIDKVENALTSTGFSIINQEHSLADGKVNYGTKDSPDFQHIPGARYFGLYHLQNVGPNGDYGWLMGVRNSHDKTFPAGIVAGNRVFVCDNLCFSGDIRVARKHTKNVLRDFNQLTMRAVGQLGAKFVQTDNRISAYKQHELTDEQASKFILDACIDARASTPSKIAEIRKEWYEPSHDAFEPRTAWSLFNAFTEAAKGTNMNTQIHRGEALYGMMDALCGVELDAA
jgi:hypothetical protein